MCVCVSTHKAWFLAKMLLKALVMQFYMSKGRGVTETVSGQLIGMPNHLRHMLDSLRVTPWV